MRRAAAFLAAQGVRQFLDIGTGIPTRPNLHEVVQEIVPGGTLAHGQAKVWFWKLYFLRRPSFRRDGDPARQRYARGSAISVPGR
jgi:hypothetical protein